MLVVTRKENQRIKIGEDIEVVVVRIKGNQVRIGVEAPEHIKIQRDDMRPERPWQQGGLRTRKELFGE